MKARVSVVVSARASSLWEPSMTQASCCLRVPDRPGRLVSLAAVEQLLLSLESPLASFREPPTTRPSDRPTSSLDSRHWRPR
jgi:hypothetical protein